MSEVSTIKEVFKEVKREWFKDLAVVELKGMNDEERREKVLQGIKECLKKNSMEIINDADVNGAGANVSASLDWGEGDMVIVAARYWEASDVVEIDSYYGKKLPESDKRDALCAMLNLLNDRFPTWHFIVRPETEMMGAKTGIFVTDHLNLQELFLLIRYMLANSFLYMAVIDEFLASDQTPEAILAQHFEKLRMEAAEDSDLDE